MEGVWRAVALVGPPGSGKGTQGTALGALPGFFHYSSGDTLRDLDPQTPLGQKVRSYTKSGELVPSRLVIDVCRQAVQDGIAADKFDPDTDMLILDGVPRNVEQAREMEAYARVQGVIHLASKDVNLLMERIQHRGNHRSDDVDSGVVEHRFRVYEQQTVPVLKYYPAALVAHIDAAQSAVRVLHQVTQALLEFGTGT